MIYPPQSAHTVHARQQLNARSKYQNVDIYTLDAPGFLELWISIQRSQGETNEQIADKLKGFGLDVTKSTLALARDHVTNAKSSLLLTALAKDLSKSGNIFSHYYITTQGGKNYIVFKSNQRLRTLITGTRYLATNTKMMTFGIGGKALKAGAKSGFVISALFSTSLHSIKWLFEEDYRWSNWIANLSVDLAKIATATIAGYLAAQATAGAYLLMVGTAPVLIPIGAGLFVCMLTAQYLSEISFKEEVNKIVDTLEYYEQKIINIDETIQDGVYYLIDETGKAVRHSICRFFLNKLNSMKNGLSPSWRF